MPDFKAERQMMLALLEQESEADPFLFFLATKLGKTVEELGQMSGTEMVQWRAYYTAKHAIENQTPVGP